MLAIIDRFDRFVTDPDVDVDKLERMLAFQEKLLARQAEIDFNEAKQRVKSALATVKIVKRKSVRYDVDKKRPALGQVEAFKYAPLEAIDEVLAPLEARHDLTCSYTTTPRQGDGGGLVISMRLKHKGGYFELFEMPLPLDTSGGKSSIQGYGSTIAYGRRYLKCTAYDIVVVGDDDDGNGGFIDQSQVDTLRNLSKRIEAVDSRRDEAALCRYLEVAALEELPQSRHREAIGVLEEAAYKMGLSLDG